MNDWASKIEDLNATAKSLAVLNVLDISFSNEMELEVYVAMTSAQRNKGLTTVDLGGLLSCYDQPSYLPILMGGMSIPTDLAWYDREGILLALHSNVPADLNNLVYVSQPYMYVLEAPAGTIPTAHLKVRA